MKLSTMIMLLMAIQVSLMVFYTTVDLGSTSAIPIVYNGSNVSVNTTGGNITTAMFYQFISDPTEWTSSAFMIALIAFIVLMAATGIRIFGSTLVSSDTVRFSGLFLVMFGLGSIPIGGLWVLISGLVTPLACAVGDVSCFLPWMIAFLCVMPITVLWFLSCLTWWRTGIIGS